MAYADVSLASTSVSNPVFGSPTYFQFGSPFSTFGANDQSARNSESATAALGSASSATGNAPQAPPANANPGSNIFGLPLWAVAGGGIGLLVITGVVVYFIARRK